MEKYDFGQLIGEGGFASVYKAFDRQNDREVAIKCINKDKLTETHLLHRVENEIRIHKCLKHAHIIRAFDSYEDKKCIYIVMDLCDGGNVFRYLKRRKQIEEIEAVFIIKQIIEAIDYLHKNGLVHRDLKLSNILIENIYNPTEDDISRNYKQSTSYHIPSAYFPEACDYENGDNDGMDLAEAPTIRSVAIAPLTPSISMKTHQSQQYSSPIFASHHDFLQVKLCDFGLTVELQHPDEEHYTLCGTPNYIAPEIVSNEAHGYPADIWSVGALYFALTMGQPLFEQEEARQWLSGNMKSRRQALKRIHSAVEDAPPRNLSTEGKDFLRQIFQTDPKVRPSVDKMLSHPLLCKYEYTFRQIQSLLSMERHSKALVLPQQQPNHDLASVKTEESPFRASNHSATAVTQDGSTEDLPHRPSRHNANNHHHHHYHTTYQVETHPSQHLPVESYHSSSREASLVTQSTPQSSALPSFQHNSSQPFLRHDPYFNDHQYFPSSSSASSSQRQQQQMLSNVSHTRRHPNHNHMPTSRHTRQSFPITSAPANLSTSSFLSSSSLSFSSLLVKSAAVSQTSPLSRSHNSLTIPHSHHSDYNSNSNQHESSQQQQVSLSRSVTDGLSLWAQSIQDLSLSSSFAATGGGNNHNYPNHYGNASPSQSNFQKTIGSQQPGSVRQVNQTADIMSVGAAFAQITEQLPLLSPFFLYSRQHDLLVFTKEGDLVYTSYDYNKQNLTATMSSIRLVLHKHQKDCFSVGKLTPAMHTTIHQQLMMYHKTQSQSSETTSTADTTTVSSKFLGPQDWQDPHERFQQFQKQRPSASSSSSSTTIFINDRTLSTMLLDFADATTCSRRNIACSELSTLSLSTTVTGQASGSKTRSLLVVVSTLLYRMVRLLKGVQCQLPRAILYCSSTALSGTRSRSTAVAPSSSATATGFLNSRRNRPRIPIITTTNKGDDGSNRNNIGSNGSAALDNSHSYQSEVDDASPNYGEDHSLVSVPPPPPPLPHTATTASAAATAVVLDMKCMLMSNFPMPDFHAQWLDGVRLIYRLQTGHILIDCPPSANISSNHGTSTKAAAGLRWEGQLSLLPTDSRQHTNSDDKMNSANKNSDGNRQSSSWSSSTVSNIPSILQPYLFAAQIALTRCLRETKAKEMQSNPSHQPSSKSFLTDRKLRGRLSTKEAHPSLGEVQYPIIIVDHN